MTWYLIDRGGNDMVKISKGGRLVRAASPESVGISSGAFIKMLDCLEEEGHEYHSLMIVRHGVVAAECWRYPFRADLPHAMYSVSKTVTATALGFAVSEGLVSLDTRIVDVFPEYRKKNETGYIDKMAVKHLVTMTSGKMPSYLLDKSEDDWLKHLFDAKWVSEPGTKFDYVNENMFVLCALLQRVTGMSVVDYLMPRLFEPLGIERPFWETDAHGVESGGWGIFLKTEDVARIMLCYLNGGMWGKTRVIPEGWAREATLNQSNHEPGKEREAGYGYGIWRKGENEYCCDGMFCQIGYVFEKEDCVVVITSCSPNENAFNKALDIFRAEGFTEPDKTVKATPEFKSSIASRRVETVPCSLLRSPMEDVISGKTIRFTDNILLNAVGFPMSVLHLSAVYMENYRAGNINNIRFDFGGDTFRFTWSEGPETNTVEAGLDGEYRYTPVTLAKTPYTVAAAAYWEDRYTLVMWIRPLESLTKRILKFSFLGNGEVDMIPSSSPPVTIMIESVAWYIRDLIKVKKLKFLADTALDKAEELIEPVHHGKINLEERE